MCSFICDTLLAASIDPHAVATPFLPERHGDRVHKPKTFAAPQKRSSDQSESSCPILEGCLLSFCTHTSIIALNSTKLCIIYIIGFLLFRPKSVAHDATDLHSELAGHSSFQLQMVARNATRKWLMWYFICTIGNGLITFLMVDVRNNWFQWGSWVCFFFYKASVKCCVLEWIHCKGLFEAVCFLWRSNTAAKIQSVSLQFIPSSFSADFQHSLTTRGFEIWTCRHSVKTFIPNS